jgi:hypothetical protein
MRPAARLSKRLCIQLFFSCHFHRAPTYPLNCPPDAAMSAPHLRDDEEFIDGLSSGVLKEFRNYYQVYASGVLKEFRNYYQVYASCHNFLPLTRHARPWRI